MGCIKYQKYEKAWKVKKKQGKKKNGGEGGAFFKGDGTKLAHCLVKMFFKEQSVQ